MSGPLDDNEAKNHPHACEFCGNFRSPAPIEMQGITKQGFLLKICSTCFNELDASCKRLVEK